MGIGQAVAIASEKARREANEAAEANAQKAAAKAVKERSTAIMEATAPLRKELELSKVSAW